MRATPALIAVCAAVAGCPKSDAPSDDDRALRILRAEKAKEPAPAPPVPTRVPADDPNAHLAQIAADDEREHPMPLPPKNDTVHLGALAVKVVELSTSHSAGTAKMRLSTEQLFLRVHLVSENVGPKRDDFDFAFARIEAGGQTYGLSPDATRLVGTKELKQGYVAGERREVILYFEVPPEAMLRGAALVLPASIGGSQDVRVALE